MRRSSKYMMAFMRQVGREVDESIKTDRDKRIRNIARAMCESAGGNPDNVVMGYIGHSAPYEPVRSVRGAVCFFEPWGPEWALYWADAKAALDYVEASA